MITRSSIQIPRDHPSFAGHFPTFPIVAGALLLDEALQIIERERGVDLTRWRLASVKFLRLVRPGEALCLDHHAPREDLVSFVIRAAGVIAVRGSLSPDLRTRMAP